MGDLELISTRTAKKVVFLYIVLVVRSAGSFYINVSIIINSLLSVDAKRKETIETQYLLLAILSSEMLCFFILFFDKALKGTVRGQIAYAYTCFRVVPLGIA
jgi:hypothetical protein